MRCRNSVWRSAIPEPADGQSWRQVLTGDDGGHTWTVATYVPVEADKVPGAMDRHTVHLKDGAYAKVTDIVCQACRAPVHTGWGRPCPGEKAAWLTGGPDHRQSPVDTPTYVRAPLAPGALPALPVETRIRHTLRDARDQPTSFPGAAPILLPQRTPAVLLPPRRGCVLATPARRRRPRTQVTAGQLMLLPLMEVA